MKLKDFLLATEYINEEELIDHKWVEKHFPPRDYTNLFEHPETLDTVENLDVSTIAEQLLCGVDMYEGRADIEDEALARNLKYYCEKLAYEALRWARDVNLYDMTMEELQQYIDNGFTPEQIGVAHLLCPADLDVPGTKERVMPFVSSGMYNKNQLLVFVDAALTQSEKKPSIFDYASPKYNAEQLRMLYVAIKMGYLDALRKIASPYATDAPWKEYSADTLRYYIEAIACGVSADLAAEYTNQSVPSGVTRAVHSLLIANSHYPDEIKLDEHTINQFISLAVGYADTISVSSIETVSRMLIEGRQLPMKMFAEDMSIKGELINIAIAACNNSGSLEEAMQFIERLNYSNAAQLLAEIRSNYTEEYHTHSEKIQKEVGTKYISIQGCQAFTCSLDNLIDDITHVCESIKNDNIKENNPALACAAEEALASALIIGFLRKDSNMLPHIARIGTDAHSLQGMIDLYYAAKDVKELTKSTVGNDIPPCESGQGQEHAKNTHGIPSKSGPAL